MLFLEPNHGMPVRQARAYVKRSCVALGAPPDDPETVVSELVTNAFTHASTDGPQGILVRCFRRGDMLWLEVLDRRSETELPVLEADMEAEGGRGLLLARALSKVFRCEAREGGYCAVVVGFEARA
ncbi:ATP-binding protein [Yinghuangia sp. YIM S10712]|uniref:ATP-binding protein n=1 Tax=Yinghuangia sp. YIM S10712 TaxID=3436930 RepID=UPI003F53B131